MKEFIKKYIKWFLIFLPIYAFIVFTCLYKINYIIYMPGNLTDMEDEVELTGYDSSKINGTISSDYIIAYEKCSLFAYYIAKDLKYSDCVKMSEYQLSNYDKKLDYAVGVYDSNISMLNAKLAAYSLLYGNESTDYYEEVVYIYSAKNNIDASMSYTSVVGKWIYKCNDILNPTYQEISNYLKTIGNDDTATLYLKDNKDKEYVLEIKRSIESSSSETKLFGLTMNITYNLTADLELKIKNNYTIGPSAGAIQSLYMYLLMSDEDILKGRKIAGTGTIGYEKDESGNITSFEYVGAIGCVGQKLYGAYIDHAEVFYCPKDNYEECMEYYNKLGFTESDIRVVSVEYLSDIINDLRNTND